MTKKEQRFMQRIVFVLSFLSEALANDMCEKCLLMNKKKRRELKKKQAFCGSWYEELLSKAHILSLVPAKDIILILKFPKRISKLNKISHHVVVPSVSFLSDYLTN